MEQVARRLGVQFEYTFEGKVEVSEWNKRTDWQPVKGKLKAWNWTEAELMLSGWMTCHAKGKAAYFVVRMRGPDGDGVYQTRTVRGSTM